MVPVSGLTLAGYFLGKRDLFLVVFLVSIIVLSGWFRHSTAIREPSQLLSYLADDATQVLYTGVVSSVDSTSEYSLGLETQPFRIYDRNISAQPVQVWIPLLAQAPVPGDTIQCVGQLSRFSLPRNPGEFNYRYYQKQRQRFFQFRVRFPWELRIIPGKKSIVPSIIRSVKKKILQSFYQTLSPESAAFASAIILGERDLMDDTLIDIYSSLGIIHVTAVSGLHVGFVTLILMFLAQLTRLKLSVRVCLVILGLLLYSALVEFRPSVVRASVMASSFLIAYASQRRYDFLNILGLAALVILLVQPLQVFQLGFQLSFLAVLGIVLISERINEILEHHDMSLSELSRPVRWISGMLIVSVAAFISTVPVTAYHFRIVPAWGIMFNLLVIPTIGLTVICLFTQLFFSLIWIKLGVFYAAFPDLIIQILQDVLKFFNMLGFQAIQVPHFPGLLSVVLFGLVLGLVLWRYSIARQVFLYGSILGMHAILFQWPMNTENIQVTFLDVGQGDATFIETEQSRILVDAGNRNLDWDAGHEVVLPYFAYRGITELDAIAISHFDSDHAGGVPALLESMTVKEIWYAAHTGYSSLFQEIDSLAGTLGIPVKAFTAGIDTTLGEIEIQTLYPGNYLLDDDPNDHSLVQRIHYGHSSLLLTGDIGVEVEEILSIYGDDLNTGLLKVPHHGSITSSSNSFIGEVQPEWAVVSVAERNRFGLPSQEVLNRYLDSGTELLLTSREGAVVFQSDGTNWKRINWR